MSDLEKAKLLEISSYQGAKNSQIVVFRLSGGRCMDLLSPEVQLCLAPHWFLGSLPSGPLL